MRVITPEHSSFPVCSMSTSLQHPPQLRRLLGRPGRVRFASLRSTVLLHVLIHPSYGSFRYVRQLTTNGRIRWNHHHRVPSASDQAPSFLARWGWVVATLYTLDISSFVHDYFHVHKVQRSILYTRLTSIRSVFVSYILCASNLVRNMQHIAQLCTFRLGIVSTSWQYGCTAYCVW